MRTLFRVFILFVFVLLQSCKAEDPEKQARQWSFHFEELRIQSLQQALSEKYEPRELAFVNANLISMKDDKIQPNQTVLVSNGKIIAIDSAEKEIPQNFLKIDCTDKYLMPGLTDMHVHNLVSSSQHLLNLANGITTVRDMDGFPWMLKMRDQIRNNKLLAPNMYVAGHILNERPMGMYATVVSTPEEARKVVRDQSVAGYDFIKVHNTMSFGIYSAILDEAKQQNIDVVGHIPHEITIRQAVEQGQKTFEHFKAYILDSSLTLTKEDYVQASKNIPNWNCPTFYNYRTHLRGDEARKLLHESPEMKYVSWRDKKDWLKLADDKPDAVQQNVLPLSIKIFKDLIPIYDKFLAGTDSGGGYEFMVPGFALQEELRIMNKNGLSPFQTLKAATVNAATAMNHDQEFGTIEVGKRADLLLLNASPLQAVANLQKIEGVAVRGIWLSHNDLDEILSQIEHIYNPPVKEQVISIPTANQVKMLQQSINELKSKGFVFRDHDVEEIKKLLNTLPPSNVHIHNTNKEPA